MTRRAGPASNLSRRRCLQASVAAALPLRCAATPAVPAGSPELASRNVAQPFTFALVGDVPSSPMEEVLHARVLERLDPDCAFVIHIGDLKSGGESCDDELLTRRHRLLDRGSALPMVFVPGDNDWVDCVRPSNGRHDPVERLQFLRRLFFARPLSIGPRPFSVERQSDLEPGTPYAENLRWTYGQATFVTLNVPGDVEWHRLDPAQGEAVRRVLAAGQRWLRRAFADNRQQVLVIAAHADPRFGRDRVGSASLQAGDTHRGYRALLRELCVGFDGQVLLVHGDTHLFRNDQPLRGDDGRVIRNLTRVESFGSPFASSWVHVRVTPGADEPFFVNVRQLPPQPATHQ